MPIKNMLVDAATSLRVRRLFCGLTCLLLVSPRLGFAGNPPGQPLAGLWHLKTNAPNYILNYTLAADRDAPYNRASVSLASRALGTAPQVNSHARANEAGIVALAGFHAAANNPSQGSLDSEYYAFSYWQYLDHLVFWGGSAGEGLVLAPNPTVVDAAHRHGVPVLGNVFLPPTAYGGDIAWVQELVKKNGSAYPVADKLIEIANYFGFDGWFINQETAGGDAALAAEVRNFVGYLKSNSTLQVMWYDAMTESGSVAWQDELNQNNDWFFQYNGQLVSDSMFVDFGWGATQIINSRTNAQGLGRSPYDVYPGVDVGVNGYGTAVSWTAVFPEGQAHRTSLGFYLPNWTYTKSSSVQDFQDRDNYFWVGPNRDPANTATTNAWKGVAHYIPDQTAIRSLPFVTTFNAGQGTRWSINGATMHPSGVASWPWNNLSVQDVLPTWRWLVESASTNKLVPAIAFDRSYYGGSSLRVSGVLDATNLIKLYKTTFVIATNTNLRVAYRLGTKGTPTNLKLALAFEDAPTTYEYLDVGNSTSTAWGTNQFSLAAYAGRRLVVAGLAFASATPVTNYSIYIGQLAFFNGTVTSPSPPSNLALEELNRIDSTSATLRLKWTHSPSSTRYYHVYRRNADQSLTWLWTTPNNACFIPCLQREGTETNVTIVLEAVNQAFGMSPQITLSVPWAVATPNLVGHYEFEDNVNDTSGRTNHGTAFGSPTYITSFDGSRAILFNGSNSYVRLPRSIGNGSFTVSLWFRCTTPDTGTTAWYTGSGLIDASATGTTNDFGTAIVGERFAFGVSQPDTTIASTTDIVNGVWHHAAAVFNLQTSEMSLYVDGVREAYEIGPAGPKNAATYLRLGGVATGGHYFTGRMDDVRLYDAPLLANEIAALSAGVDPLATPALTAVPAGGTNIYTLTSPAVAGRVYQFQSTTNLLSGAWQPVGSPGVPTNYTFACSVTNASEPCRFYRLLELR